MSGIDVTAGNKEKPTGFAMTLYKWRVSLKTPTPYLMTFGVFLWIGTYYLFCEGWQLPRFNKLPGPLEVITEWISRDPDWGISLFTEDYHDHIIVSCQRILISFAIAVSFLHVFLKHIRSFFRMAVLDARVFWD